MDRIGCKFGKITLSTKSKIAFSALYNKNNSNKYVTLKKLKKELNFWSEIRKIKKN